MCISVRHSFSTLPCFSQMSVSIHPHRAGSAILLKLPGTMGSMLMDCGEGTWGQMLRCLGPEVARQQVSTFFSISAFCTKSVSVWSEVARQQVGTISRSLLCTKSVSVWSEVALTVQPCALSLHRLPPCAASGCHTSTQTTPWACVVC